MTMKQSEERSKRNRRLLNAWHNLYMLVLVRHTCWLGQYGDAVVEYGRQDISKRIPWNDKHNLCFKIGRLTLILRLLHWAHPVRDFEWLLRETITYVVLLPWLPNASKLELIRHWWWIGIRLNRGQNTMKEMQSLPNRSNVNVKRSIQTSVRDGLYSKGEIFRGRT